MSSGKKLMLVDSSGNEIPAKADSSGALVVSSLTSGGGSSDTNYTIRYTYDPTTNLLSYVTRTQGAVTEIQNYVRNAAGTLLGIDAWVVV
jgi:hypothetical protein